MIDKQINIFVTCLCDTFYPGCTGATVQVLEKLGFRVSYPTAQTCCGQPMFNAGYFDQSRKVARYFIETFSHTNTPIVAPSSSCVSMIRKHYLKLFENEPTWLEKAKQLGDRTYEFCEFLTKKLHIDLAGFHTTFNGSVAFHRSCHYRELEIAEEPISLIKQISGINYVPLDNIEQCCGFGGTFSVKFPHISEGMVREKLKSIKKTGADWLIFGDAGCAMNITGYANRIGQPIKAMHIAELINRSLRN